MAKAKGFIKAASVEKYTETEKGDATAAILGLTEGQPETAPKKRGRKPKADKPEAVKSKRGRKPKTSQTKAPAAQSDEKTASTSTGRTVTITLREGESVNTAVIEAKKKRVQLVFRPSLYDRLKAESDRRGVSVNECIHQILEISLP